MKTWWVRTYYTANEGQALRHFGPFESEEAAQLWVNRTLSEVRARLASSPGRPRGYAQEITDQIGFEVHSKNPFIYGVDMFWDEIVRPLVVEGRK